MRGRKSLGCFPFLVISILIMGALTIYPIVTHPPVDYIKLFLTIVTLAIFLVVWSPWLKDMRNWHPTIVLVPFVAMMLVAIYPLITQHSVNYVLLLLTIATYTSLAVPSSPWYSSMVRRNPLIIVIVAGLTIFVSCLQFVLYPHPDYFGIFWLAIGAIVFAFVIGSLARRRQQIATTNTTHEEPTVSHRNAEIVDEEPTSERTILGIHIKFYRHGRFGRIDFRF
jgi:hypothetical protein